MTWVTCQSATTNETFAVNTHLVKKVKDRTTCAVVEFIDGTQFTIQGNLQDWLSKVESSPRDMGRIQQL